MITVVGVSQGRPVESFPLEHGADPVTVLAERGWAATADRVDGVLGDLTLRFRVERLAGGARRRQPTAPRGPGLAPGERADVRPHQRVAAYAVVVSGDRVLLTQLAPNTGAAGRWNLPGGGVDPGEAPVDAVVREVLEETGQHVVDVRLLDVVTQHWVGPGSRGPEDYHAVRLLHTAHCPRPTAPVVHDVGGSTADARWVPLDGLGGVEVVESVPVALRAAGLHDLHARRQS